MINKRIKAEPASREENRRREVTVGTEEGEGAPRSRRGGLYDVAGGYSDGHGVSQSIRGELMELNVSVTQLEPQQRDQAAPPPFQGEIVVTHPTERNSLGHLRAGWCFFG